MKKNLKTLVERPKYERPQCLVSMNHIDLVEACGMKVDLRHKRSAHLSGMWKPLERESISIPLGGADLSAFSYLTFSIFAGSCKGMRLELLLEAGNSANGYTADIRMEASGWNHISLALAKLVAVGAPDGWQAISAIRLSYKKGRRLPTSALCLDNFYLWKNTPPRIYELIPDLKRAVVFSEFGTSSLVKGRRVLNSPFGNATPKQDPNSGEFWVPFYPIVAGSVRAAEADTKAKSLTFTYRKQRYVFAADKPWVMLDGKRQMMNFAPIDENGCLLLPASYAASFFSRKYSLAKDGILVFSNRKNWFLKAGKGLNQELLAATTFPPIDLDLLSDKLLRQYAGTSKPRILFTKEGVTELRKAAKGDEDFKALLATLESDLSASAKKKCISVTLCYLATGKKKLVPKILELADTLALDQQDLAEFGRETYVLSLAYDVLRPALSEAEKAALERKLLRACLRPGISYYAGEATTAATGSFSSISLASGMTAAALAMMDAYPETARKLLLESLDQLQNECLLANAKTKGLTDLLLGVRALESALSDACGCLSLPEIKAAYTDLFSGESIADFLHLLQALFTK